MANLAINKVKYYQYVQMYVAMQLWYSTSNNTPVPLSTLQESELCTRKSTLFIWRTILPCTWSSHRQVGLENSPRDNNAQIAPAASGHRRDCFLAERVCLHGYATIVRKQGMNPFGKRAQVLHEGFNTNQIVFRRNKLKLQASTPRFSLVRQCLYSCRIAFSEKTYFDHARHSPSTSWESYRSLQWPANTIEDP